MMTYVHKVTLLRPGCDWSYVIAGQQGSGEEGQSCGATGPSLSAATTFSHAPSMAMVGRRALETGTKIEQSDRMKRGAEAMDHMRKIMYFFFISKHVNIS